MTKGQSKGQSKGQTKGGSFQVQLSGSWTDYEGDEDRILKRAYLAGFPNARYTLRGQSYEVDFRGMAQKNQTTGKDRRIRPPHRWRAPAAPICRPGPTTCIKVPEGAAGTTIQVPHPRARGQFISVDVPATARPGQAMLVPVPPAADVAPEPAAAPEPTAPPPPSAPPAPSAPGRPAPAAAKKGWGIGAKVAAGVTGAAAVGGLAVAGVVLGEHIAEEGWDATVADVGDWFEGAGETIADGAEAAVDWVGDAADATGDFIMDLF